MADLTTARQLCTGNHGEAASHPPQAAVHHSIRWNVVFLAIALPFGTLRYRQRRHAPLCSLLECVRELNEPWLAARCPGEAHPIRRRPRIEALWEWWRRRVRHDAEWHDDGGIARRRCDHIPARAREEQRLQLMLLHHGVDAVRGAQQQ